VAKAPPHCRAKSGTAGNTVRTYSRRLPFGLARGWTPAAPCTLRTEHAVGPPGRIARAVCQLFPRLPLQCFEQHLPGEGRRLIARHALAGLSARASSMSKTAVAASGMLINRRTACASRESSPLSTIPARIRVVSAVPDRATFQHIEGPSVSFRQKRTVSGAAVETRSATKSTWRAPGRVLQVPVQRIQPRAESFPKLHYFGQSRRFAGHRGVHHAQPQGVCASALRAAPVAQATWR